MSKYTPGPWKAFIRGRTIAILTRETQAVIAWPGFDSSSYNLKTQKANARLIAAAPDLADVARMVLRYAEQSAPELVQAAAVAVKAIETIDRRNRR